MEVTCSKSSSTDANLSTVEEWLLLLSLECLTAGGQFAWTAGKSLGNR
jgi:hypothetical protein